VGVQALNPLAVKAVGLGTALDAAGVGGGPQDHREATVLQEGEQRFPVDAGGLQGDGGDATPLEPVGEGFEAVGVGVELGDLRRAVGQRRCSGPVTAQAEIDAAGVAVADRQRVVISVPGWVWGGTALGDGGRWHGGRGVAGFLLAA
jgi:hypothetical protein